MSQLSGGDKLDYMGGEIIIYTKKWIESTTESSNKIVTILQLYTSVWTFESKSN